MTELGGAAEEAVGNPAERVVDHVGAAYLAEPARAQEPGDREATVHQTVVNQHVCQAERRHPRAHTETERRGKRPGQAAANDDQHHGHGRVNGGEQIVALEAAVTRLMMGAMDRPERAVPDPSVENAGPGLHGGGDGRADGEHQAEVCGEAHR
jgi:hypothetical protein